MSKLCIYHANCADGFTSAWVIMKRFGKSVQFFPGVYGEQPPAVDGLDVFIVDFSYDLKTMRDIIKRAASVTILDHHKSAEGTLRTLMDEGHRDHRFSCVFDMERSGAGITWDYFYPDIPRPILVEIVEDRDLWKFKYSDTRPIMACIFSYEYTFDDWDYINMELNSPDGMRRFIQDGRAIEHKHFKDIKELLKVCRRKMVIGGYPVDVANLPYTMSSDAGHIMALESGGLFAACYIDFKDHRYFSLRSTSDGEDVSVIAKKYGGGGHKTAAGFRVPLGWSGDNNEAE